jgi:heat shock protein HtpX
MTFMNRLKTTILLAALTGLFLLVGSLLGGRSGLTIAFLLALAMNGLTYFFSDRLVLAMYGAKPASEQEYPGLHRMVDGLCAEAGIPKPRLYIVTSATPNAFATGRSPQHAAVACTTGILDLLTQDELRGVLAHELSHVRNRDILVSTIAATIAGALSYLAQMAQFAAIFGGMGGRDRDRGGNALGLLVMAILAPLIAMLLHMAISRSREYLADSSGARLLNTGEPLARALEKLETGVRHRPLQHGSPATAGLFIVHPFRGQGLFHLFSTHPPTHERAARLRKMKF